VGYGRAILGSRFKHSRLTRPEAMTNRYWLDAVLETASSRICFRGRSGTG
jgi:hypothetical protein